VSARDPEAMRTITDLIARLEAIRAERGNVRVKIWDDYDACYIECISLYDDDESSPVIVIQGADGGWSHEDDA
jgi:hypothetical protein